jgi:hypothetical protein
MHGSLRLSVSPVVVLVANVGDDAVMGPRRWVIIGVGGAVAVCLGVAAAVFGLQGVEVASWLAGIAGVVVAVAAIVLAPAAPPSTPRPASPSTSQREARSTSSGERSISAGGNIDGIASTGDHTTNTQQR